MYLDKAQEIRNETLKESVFVRRHESGLPVYFCPKPGFKKRYACFATHFGSADSNYQLEGEAARQVPDGIAHFLEHKVFEGEEGNALELFSQAGASCNAYTSFNVTNYLFSCSQNFYKNLDHLVDFVLTPYFTHENVEKEKEIIAQEIRMYEDHPSWRSYFMLLEGMYQKAGIRHEIAGTVESIQAIDAEQLLHCHQTFYHPENMILFAIGDENADDYFEFVDKLLGKREWQARGDVIRHIPVEPIELAKPHQMISMPVAMPKVLLGFKDRTLLGKRGRDLLEHEFTSDLLMDLIFGKATDFFQSFYEEKLIDDSFSCDYSAYGDSGFSVLGGDTPKPDQLRTEVLSQIEKVKQTGLSESDFERLKRASLGRLIRLFNSLEYTANNFCTYRFSEVNLFDVVDVLHGLKFEKLNERLTEHLVEDALCMSLVEPKVTP